MLVDFFRKNDEKRIYQFDSDRNYTTFSSNNNLMFAKDSYAAAARYQLHNRFQEDVYLCLAHIKQGNRYMINPKIRIKHLPRTRFADLVSQFFDYGRYFSEGTAAIDYQGLEIFANFVLTPRLSRRALILKTRFPFGFLCFASFFHLMLLFVALALAAPNPVTRLGCLGFAALYFVSDLRFLSVGVGTAARLAAARLCVNAALLCGNVVGSIAQGKVILGPLIEACQNNVVYVRKGAALPSRAARRFGDAIDDLTTRSPSQLDELELESTAGPYVVVEWAGLFWLLKSRSFFVGYDLVNVSESRFGLLLRY